MWVDEPTPGQRVVGTVRIAGWAHIGDAGVGRVRIALGGHRVDAQIGRHRPDVGVALDDPAAAFAGYEAQIDTAAMGLSGSVEVTVEVDDMDARHVLSGTVQIMVERETLPSPVQLRTTPAHGRRRWRRRVRTPVRLLLAARSLDHGGSQLRMAELAESLVHDPRFDVAVLSPADGPLRSRLEEAGVAVHLRPGVPYDDPEAYDAGVAELAAWMHERVDLVFGFTITSFDALDAAATLRLPRMLRVGEHESLGTVAQWINRALHPEVEARAVRAIAAAQAVVFLSRTGREVHRSHGLHGRFVVLPSGIDTRRPEAYALTKAQAREQLGLPREGRIAIFPASLWTIKSQAVLVRAFAAVADRHPDLHLVLLGYGYQDYIDAVQRVVDAIGLADRITIMPFTEDLSPWWRAADLMAFSSESEAGPAVILEAGAWGIPVVATRVGNVAEVVIDGASGWLCRPSDAADLARALDAAASASEATLQRMGAELQARVCRDHDHESNLDRMVRVMLALATGRRPGGSVLL